MSEKDRSLVGCCDCGRGFPLETMHCYDHDHFLCGRCQKKVDEYFEQNPLPIKTKKATQRRVTPPCTDGRRHKWRSCGSKQGSCYKCGVYYSAIVKHKEPK